jgi:hypothetical protein
VIAALSCGIDALMFGSLMMLASGVVASAPSSASASGTRPNAARMRPASEMSRVSTATPAAPANASMIGQERVRGQRRGLVGVRVDDLHRAAFSPRGPARTTRYLPRPTTRGDYRGVTSFRGVTLAKRRYFIMKETGAGKLRVDFRSWPLVIVIGLILAILSLIDRGGLGEATAVVEGQACTFTVTGTDVNVRTGATAASPSVQEAQPGRDRRRHPDGDQRVPPDGRRRLGARLLLTPVPGTVMHLMAR